MSKTFQAPGTLTAFSLTSDGSLRLGFVTQELQGEEKENAIRLAFNFHRMFGWMLFKESEVAFNDSEIPKEDPVEKGQKTPSKRLRDVLFVKWNQRGRQAVDWDTFYKKEMESIINYQKQQLED